ncbi:MAG: DUF6061 family protein [Peptococcaceae bacterium]
MDWLIYGVLLKYADLILNGKLEINLEVVTKKFSLD